MLKIRLTRVGKKNSPAYRVVVADQRKAVKRKFIEILGHYNPITNPKQLVINKERSLYWISKGAQASDTVHNLMCDLGILDKKDKIKKVYAKKKEVEEAPTETAETKADEEKVESPAAKENPEEPKATEEPAEVAAEPITETPSEEESKSEETKQE
ncbi:MAG: 30S ribosomal protein S16 [Patescibacteria group bacterium]